jgi:hypothetical protein
MATKPEVIGMNPSWTTAQKIGFNRIKDALPVALGYLSDEMPILDNHTDKMLVDEVGSLKQAKKILEKAEKAHVERLKARMAGIKLPLKEGEEQKYGADSLKGDAYEATYRGGGRVILNQEACKELIQEATDEGIHLKRLMAAIKAGQIELPQNVLLKDMQPATGTEAAIPQETNGPDFFTTAAGGRALYVEPIA